MIAQLQLYFQYPFVRYALIVGTLIALCAALLGVTLVLKRYSFIGDGLSHVAFGSMAVATVLSIANPSVAAMVASLQSVAWLAWLGNGLSAFSSALVTNNTLLVLPLTMLAAIWLLRGGKGSKTRGDAVLAVISVSTLALGYLILNLFPTSSNLSADVCSTLFGSFRILQLSQSDVIVCAALSAAVIVAYVLFYNKIFAVTFDETFARATGTNAGLYNLLIAVVIAVIIVLAMNLVGSLLISALIIFPALSAMRLFKSFRGVIVCSAVLGVTCAVAGILASILANTPVGSTIVAADVAAYLLCSLLHRILHGRSE
jgi:zinc transport system permease protein